MRWQIMEPGDAVVHHVGILHRRASPLPTPPPPAPKPSVSKLLRPVCRADANASASRTRLAVGCVYEADSCTLDPVGCATLPTSPQTLAQGSTIRDLLSS